MNKKTLGAQSATAVETASPIAPDAATTRHTPGPWGARFSEMGGYDCMTHAWRVGPQRGLPAISVCTIDLSSYGQRACDFDFKNEQAEADAHLIAAAPEMYEALRDAVAALGGRRNYVGPQSVLNAIAKAEGRS